MMLRALLVAAALLAATPVLAQSKVSITADLFTIDETTREAVFTGNVVVVHPTVTVNAPKVIAHYGEGGTSDIESFEAFGPDVKLTTKEQVATGDNAVFTPADQLLRLTGNVIVTTSGNRVSAGELIHNLELNQSTFTASEGGRVTGVFNSQ